MLRDHGAGALNSDQFYAQGKRGRAQGDPGGPERTELTTRSAETQPRDGVDNKNARSAARRCRSRCSKLTPRTRGAKEERGVSADST
jgi:hypothetical protein